MSTFIDGFEEFSGSGSPGALITRAEYASVGTWTIVRGRSSLPNSAALAGSHCNLGRTFDWEGSRFSCGSAHNFSARGSIMWVTAGGSSVVLWMHEESGTPMMNDNVGGALPTKNRWYYYEFDIDRGANTISLYINNKFDSQMALPASFAGAEEITVGLGWKNVTDYRPLSTYRDDGNKFIDDFYARVGPRIGPVIVSTRFPTHDENVEWFKASPTMTHADSLSQHPPDPLDSYVASDTIGKEERFTSSEQLANTNAVLATAMVVMARKAPTLSAKLGIFMGGNAGGVAERTDVLEVGSDWKTKYVLFAEVPADTKATVEASQFGINVAAP